MLTPVISRPYVPLLLPVSFSPRFAFRSVRFVSLPVFCFSASAFFSCLLFFPSGFVRLAVFLFLFLLNQAHKKLSELGAVWEPEGGFTI